MDAYAQELNNLDGFSQIILKAIKDNNIDALTSFFDLGLDANGTWPIESSYSYYQGINIPYLHAALHYPETTQLFLDNGADPNKEDSNTGTSPLEVILNGYEDDNVYFENYPQKIIKMLLEAGAKPTRPRFQDYYEDYRNQDDFEFYMDVLRYADLKLHDYEDMMDYLTEYLDDDLLNYPKIFDLFDMLSERNKGINLQNDDGEYLLFDNAAYFKNANLLAKYINQEIVNYYITKNKPIEFLNHITDQNQYDRIVKLIGNFDISEKQHLKYVSDYGFDVTPHVNKFKKTHKLNKAFTSKRKKFLQSDTQPHTYYNLHQADPTPTNKHINWLLSSYKNNTIKDKELFRLRDTPLKEYAILSKLTQVTPIANIDGYDDLLPLIESNRSLLEQISDDNRTIYCENDDVKVIIPLTQEASCKYGAGTRWCTAAKNDNQFKYYTKTGPNVGLLYIIIPKVAPEEKYELHVESGQLMNSDDDPVQVEELLQYGKGVFDCVKEIMTEHIYSDEEIGIYKPTHMKRHYGVTDKYDLVLLYNNKFYNVNSKGESKQKLDSNLFEKLITGLNPTTLDLFSSA